MLACRQPKWYGERMRRKIQAGANVENLRLRCPYFYDVALLLHGIEHGPSLAEFAMKTFQARYKVAFSPSCSVSIATGLIPMHCWPTWSIAAVCNDVAVAVYQVGSSLLCSSNLLRGTRLERSLSQLVKRMSGAGVLW